MIDWEQWMDIKELHRQGMSQRQIAQRTGHSRNTVAKTLGQSAPQPSGKPEPRPSALAPYKPYLQERYQLYQLSGVRLHEEVVAQGFAGSVDIVQRYLKGLKEQHPLMADFAAHYGFAVKTHRPYRPRTKGKVERSVRFAEVSGGADTDVEENFLKGRAFADFADLSVQAGQWLERANQRVHATTGERPIDTLAREKLTSIGSFVPYVLAQRHERRVDAEGFVRVQRSRYSVPPQFVGKRVVVALGQQQVTSRLGEAIIAEHRPVPPGQSAVDAQHVAAFWKLATQATSARHVPPIHGVLPISAAVEVRPLAVYEEMVS